MQCGVYCGFVSGTHSIGFARYSIDLAREV